MVARTSRSRRTWSPSEPTAHDRSTYGAIRAAPARPTTQAPCPASPPYRSQTRTSSSGHGSPVATAAHAYAASSRASTGGLPRCAFIR